VSSVQKPADSRTYARIQQLIEEFHNRDGLRRKAARERLTEIGMSAVTQLIKALDDDEQMVRWEAARTLKDVNDPSAAPALVNALMDESFEVQWLAAEALIALQQDAIKPILKALTKNSGSQYLRQGAHHVLHALERNGQLPRPIVDFLDALRSFEPVERIPGLARYALKSLK
jgi:HEAT repeat protein